MPEPRLEKKSAIVFCGTRFYRQGGCADNSRLAQAWFCILGLQGDCMCNDVNPYFLHLHSDVTMQSKLNFGMPAQPVPSHDTVLPLAALADSMYGIDKMSQKDLARYIIHLEKFLADLDYIADVVRIRLQAPDGNEELYQKIMKEIEDRIYYWDTELQEYKNALEKTKR